MLFIMLNFTRTLIGENVEKHNMGVQISIASTPIQVHCSLTKQPSNHIVDETLIGEMVREHT